MFWGRVEEEKEEEEEQDDDEKCNMRHLVVWQSKKLEKIPMASVNSSRYTVFVLVYTEKEMVTSCFRQSQETKYNLILLDTNSVLKEFHFSSIGL